jgi:L-alanine-DL-glutamate epimerase-like enolase superfamily enzyme
MRARVDRLALRLRTPMRSAWGTLTEREVLLLRVRDRDGHAGVGEAAPLEPYDGVPLAVCRAGLEAAARVLERGGSRGDAMAAAGPPPAAAAVDVALWDLEGRRTGRPVWSLLGAADGGSVAVSALIGASDRAGAAREAAAARAAGFSCVKAKVGIGDDHGRLAAVRAALGPDVALRVDANGAWDLAGARAALETLAPVGLELCEEPVSGVPALRALRGTVPVAIAMDETTSAPGAVAAGAVDAVCLKVGHCGGITGVVAAARAARRAGSVVYLASVIDSPVGIAAALHAAAVVRPERASGLATLGLLDGVEDPFPAREGSIAVPVGPGLGV